MGADGDGEEDVAAGILLRRESFENGPFESYLEEMSKVAEVSLAGTWKESLD